MKIAARVMLTLSLLFIAAHATAAPVSRLVTDVGSKVDRAVAMAVQPDDKIILSGTTEVTHGSVPDLDVVLIRTLPDGSIDPTFGNSGIVVDNFYLFGSIGSMDVTGGVVVAPDGTIWVNAVSDVNWVLAAYDPTGARIGDPIVLHAGVSASIGAGGVTVDTNGRVIATASIVEHSLVMSRVDRYDPADGTHAPLDTFLDGRSYRAVVPFGAAGVLAAGSEYGAMAAGRISGASHVVARTATTALSGIAYALAYDGTDVAALAGSSGDGIGVVRIQRGRTPAMATIGPLEPARSVVIDSAGRIVVAGSDGEKAVLLRLVDQDGALVLDPAFGTGGIRYFGKPGGDAEIHGLHRASNKLYLWGHGRRPGDDDYDLFLLVLQYPKG